MLTSVESLHRRQDSLAAKIKSSLTSVIRPEGPCDVNRERARFAITIPLDCLDIDNFVQALNECRPLLADFKLSREEERTALENIAMEEATRPKMPHESPHTGIM